MMFFQSSRCGKEHRNQFNADETERLKKSAWKQRVLQKRQVFMSLRTENQDRENRLNLKDFKGGELYFCGIGGTSMSGLAQICRAQGYRVRGSDRVESPFTRELEAQGLAVIIGQKAENVEGTSLFVYSAAIKPEHPERAEAARLGIPEMERSVLLGQISRHYRQVICIAGCHGKTTITSMLALMTMKGGLDPTIHVGGMVPFLSGGVRVGGDEIFITEACEYVESFMTLHPTAAALNNIDDDHLDYFRDIDHITETFGHFLELLPDGAPLYGGMDDPRVEALLAEDRFQRLKITGYGLHAGDYRAENLHPDGGGVAFDVTFRGDVLGTARLAVPGKHNVVDALCAIAIARDLGVDFSTIAEALAEYRLTGRRFEHMGDIDGVAIYHDYAHHPAEIATCLEGAKSVCSGKLWALFQCNSYSRAKTLFSKDVTCFASADGVLVPDIYPGREVDDGSVHARDMVAAINAGEGTEKALYIPTFEEIATYLKAHWQPGDMVVTLGSGDVYVQTPKLYT